MFLAWLRPLSPALTLQAVVDDLAETGSDRYQSFLQKVTDYHREWRVLPRPRLRAEPVRLADYAHIPRFAFAHDPRPAWGPVVWTGLLALLGGDRQRSRGDAAGAEGARGSAEPAMGVSQNVAASKRGFSRSTMRPPEGCSAGVVGRVTYAPAGAARVAGCRVGRRAPAPGAPPAAAHPHITGNTPGAAVGARGRGHPAHLDDRPRCQRSAAGPLRCRPQRTLSPAEVRRLEDHVRQEQGRAGFFTTITLDGNAVPTPRRRASAPASIRAAWCTSSRADPGQRRTPRDGRRGGRRSELLRRVHAGAGHARQGLGERTVRGRVPGHPGESRVHVRCDQVHVHATRPIGNVAPARWRPHQRGSGQRVELRGPSRRRQALPGWRRGGLPGLVPPERSVDRLSQSKPSRFASHDRRVADRLGA